MVSQHFIIKGKVQGVFFRASTKTRALELDIKGWVKNTEAGHVEVLVQGNENQLMRFEAWCRIGPSRARVETFEKRSIESTPFDGFDIL